MSYVKNVLIAIDQLGNTILGGKPDETISAKTYRMYKKTGKWYWKYTMSAIDFLFNDPVHCYESYLAEVKRKQIADEYSNFWDK